MAVKYHIRKDETLGVCTAEPGNCPISSTELGESYHGTREEVTDEIERRFQETYGPLGVTQGEKYLLSDNTGQIVARALRGVYDQHTDLATLINVKEAVNERLKAAREVAEFHKQYGEPYNSKIVTSLRATSKRVNERLNERLKELEGVKEEKVEPTRDHAADFVTGLNDKFKDAKPFARKYTVEKGRKYDRIVAQYADSKFSNQKQVYAFVERATGNFFKADSWRIPAKGARYGSIDEAIEYADVHGGFLYWDAIKSREKKEAEEALIKGDDS